jgi:hypothetical protein
VLHGKGHETANDRLFWGRVGDIGYLNFLSLAAFSDGDASDTTARRFSKTVRRSEGPPARVCVIPAVEEFSTMLRSHRDQPLPSCRSRVAATVAQIDHAP